MSEEGWVFADAKTSMEDNSSNAVTEVIVVAKKENVPPEYVLLSETCFSEGLFTKRYLAYSKKIPAPKKGRVGVTDLLVVSDKETTPLGYDALNQTFDDNTKSFSNKQLLVKYTPLDQATHVIGEIRVLSASQKEQVPPGYKRLPEISGVSICYKASVLASKRISTQGSISQPSTEHVANVDQRQPQQQQQQQQQQSNISVQRTVIDDVKVTVIETSSTVQDHIDKVTLPEMEILTLDAINAKFNFNWTEIEQIVSQS